MLAGRSSGYQDGRCCCIARTVTRGRRPPGVSFTPSPTVASSSRTLSGTSPSTARTLRSVAARSNGRRPVSDPLPHVRVIGMPRAPQDLLAALRTRPARRSPRAGRRPPVDAPRLGAAGTEDLDVVVPVVAEVVDVGEARRQR